MRLGESDRFHLLMCRWRFLVIISTTLVLTAVLCLFVLLLSSLLHSSDNFFVNSESVVDFFFICLQQLPPRGLNMMQHKPKRRNRCVFVLGV